METHEEILEKLEKAMAKNAVEIVELEFEIGLKKTDYFRLRAKKIDLISRWEYEKKVTSES